MNGGGGGRGAQCGSRIWEGKVGERRDGKGFYLNQLKENGIETIYIFIWKDSYPNFFFSNFLILWKRFILLREIFQFIIQKVFF